MTLRIGPVLWTVLAGSCSSSTTTSQAPKAYATASPSPQASSTAGGILKNVRTARLDGAFIEASKLVQPFIKERPTKQELVDQIQNESGFFLNPPEDQPEEDAMGRCIASRLNSIRFTATGSSLQASGTAQLLECLAGSEVAEDITRFDLRYLLAVECAGVDLKGFDGKTFKEIDLALAKTCDQATETGDFLNLEMTSNFKMSSPEGDEFDATVVSIIAQMDDLGRPCIAKRVNEVWSFSPCNYLSRDDYTSFLVNGVEVDRTYKPDSSFWQLRGESLTSKSLLDQYYKTGTVAFRFNGWSGSMTYQGERDPSWRARFLEEEAHGTYSFGSGLSLTSPIQNQNRMWKKLKSKK
jgi:hypothetical protein